jgi:hypothetical protein
MNTTGMTTFEILLFLALFAFIFFVSYLFYQQSSLDSSSTPAATILVLPGKE